MHSIHDTKTHEIIQVGTINADGAVTSYQTVAFDSAIPPNLRAGLEGMQPFGGNKFPRNHKVNGNTRVHSYCNLTIDGVCWYVLSQGVEANVEHSQPSTLMIHHIAFQANEAPLEGPAWLLIRPGFLMDNWLSTDTVVQFRCGRPIPRTPKILFGRQYRPGTIKLPLWKKLSGDVGWAGVLAETVYEDHNAVIVYPPGIDLLQLFSEALSILPPEKRWQVTFATFTVDSQANGKTPLAVRWSGVLQDTPQANNNPFISNTLVLDLTKPLGTPHDSVFVSAARNGEFVSDDMDNVPASENDFEVNSNGADELEESDEPPTVADNFIPLKLPKTEKLVAQAQAIMNPPPLPVVPNVASDKTEMEAEHDNGKPPVNEQSSITPPLLPVPPPLPTIDVGGSLQLTNNSKNIDNLIRKQSRAVFYSVYVAAAGLLAVMLVLLLDMRLEWGIVDSLRDSFSTRGSNAEPELKKPVPEKPIEKEPSEKPAEVAATPPEEESKPAPSDLENAAAEQQKKATEIEAERQRLTDEFAKLRNEESPKSQAVLDECKFPEYVDLRIPLPREGDENIGVAENEPDLKKPLSTTVNELSTLFTIAHALQINIAPLLERGGVTYECREAEIDVETGLTEVHWIISSYEKETDRRHDLTMLTLNKEGLTFSWLPDSLNKLNYADTGRIPFSYITFTAVTEEPSVPDSNQHKVALFVPRKIEPFTVSELKEKPEQTRPLFFAEPNWQAVFEGDIPTKYLQLETEIKPETTPGYSGFEVLEGTVPQRLLLSLFSDDIRDVTRKDFLGTRTTLEVADREGKLTMVFTDGSAKQREDAATFLREHKAKRADEEKSIDKLQRSILSGDAKVKEELEASRKRFDNTKEEYNEICRRMEHLVESLPKVRESILKLGDLKVIPKLYITKENKKLLLYTTQE
ncbi:MAG: hypothetical protein LBU65_09380 [Planctomycetaceae bacterium]|jgi:hypothetical protein|nr:hypothetical protein [Planctomycetaceae bacterium]